jgi:outer membrane protein assembly factor BamB
MNASPDNANARPVSPLRLRLATLLFPPYGLVLLWRTPRGLWRKLLGTIGIVLFAFLYCGLFLFIFVRIGALKIEWRGGYAPAFTWRKSLPDYDALERHRAEQTARIGNIDIESSVPWPGFRGPNRDSHYDDKPILTNWPSSGLKLLWRQPIGGGYSSFAIAHGWAFTIEQRRDSEVAVAYDFNTGREVWTCAWPDHFQEYFSEEGPRSTPSYSDGKIYVLGAMGELRCLDAESGKAIWSRNIVVENHGTVPNYGIASSPLIIGDKLIVQSSAGNGKSVLCLDKRDGKLIWSALDDPTGYASPALLNFAGQDQIIICAERRTIGLSIEEGKVLWEIPWHVLHDQMPIAQPVLLSTNRFLLSAGYFTGCAAVEVTRSASGFAAHTLWQNKNLKNKFTSSVFYQGYVYGLDEDILTCLDAATGERKWKDGRYGYGQLILAAGRSAAGATDEDKGGTGRAASGYLVILSGDGELALVKATPERYEELARFHAITGKTWNHPAIADGKILVRNAQEMACLQIAP